MVNLLISILMGIVGFLFVISIFYRKRYLNLEKENFSLKLYLDTQRDYTKTLEKELINTRRYIKKLKQK